MINRIIKALENQNIELNHREIADAIWLALKMYEMEQSQNEQKSKAVNDKPSQNSLIEPASNNSEQIKTDNQLDYKKEPSETVPLHVAKKQQNANDTNNEESKSIPTKVPTAKALPKQLEIARALKPLLQKQDSKTEYVIDEEATVRRIKEEKIWLPVLKPKLVPRYNLELIIDISESMELWQKTIAEFELLLKRHGAFGNVQSWLLDTDKETLPLSKKANGVKQGSLRSYKELSSIGSDHLILIISDCVSSAWYGKEITKQINFWSKTNCVAILQVLPKTLWENTSLGKRPIVEVETINNKVNAKLKTEVTDFDPYKSDEPNEKKQPESVIVPIITFHSIIMNAWANSLVGIPDFWVLGAKFFVEERIASSKEKLALSPKQIVQLFYANASPTARKLAIYLSFLPFDFSIVNIVIKQLVQEAQQSHIAEVFLSGLIRKVKVETNNQPSFIYDFVEGTREIIINTSFNISSEIDTIEESEIPNRIEQIKEERKKIITSITQYLKRNQGSTTDFVALIKSIKGSLNTELSEPFANIKTEILKIVDKEYNSNLPNIDDIIPKTTLPEYKSLYTTIAEEIRLKDMDTVEELSAKMSKLKELEEKVSKLLSPTEFAEWKKENNRFITLLQRNYQDWNGWKSINQDEVIDLSYQDLSKYKLHLNFIDFNNVNLRGSDLTGIDLTKASINNADLSEAILIGTKLGSATLVNSKLVKAQLAGNNILYSDFSGADLSEADLTGVSLTEVKLNDVNFTKTKLTRAKLENTPLSMANFDEAHWGDNELWDVDLTTAKNLETIKHGSFSMIAFTHKDILINKLPANFLKNICVVKYGKFEYETVKVDKKGKIIERTKKQANQIIDDLGKGVVLEMVEIPSGEFMMGSPEGEGNSWEKPQHKVTVPTFYMGKYQVTQEQWEAVMGSNPSYFKGSGKLPVEKVSWNDAIEFCKRLSEKTNKIYRLPSEAEWEYACRAGTETPFAFGETINTDIVNYNGNRPYGEGTKGEYREKTTVVGSLGVANEFGLYDMHGNVWEWCQDAWHSNYDGAPTDGSVRDDQLSNNTYRVLRGGSYDDDAYYCRSASRDTVTPGNRVDDIGLRLVMAARTLK